MDAQARLSAALAANKRWCEVHQHDHGPLYLCPEYPDEVKAEVEELEELYIKWLRNAVPRTPQDALALSIFTMFAGIDDAPPPGGRDHE